MKTKNNTIGHGFKMLGRTLKNTIKNPVEAGAEFFEKGSVVDSIVMLAFVFLVYCGAAIVSGTVLLIKYTTLYNGIYSGPELVGRYIGNFLFPPFYFFLMIALLLGVYALVKAIFIKRKMNWRAFLSFIAAPGVALMVASIIYTVHLSILYMVSLKAVSIICTILFGTVQTLVGLIILLIGYKNVRKVFPDNMQFFLVSAIAVVLLTIGSYIIAYPLNYIDPWFFTIPM